MHTYMLVWCAWRLNGKSWVTTYHRYVWNTSKGNAICFPGRRQIQCMRECTPFFFPMHLACRSGHHEAGFWKEGERLPRCLPIQQRDCRQLKLPNLLQYPCQRFLECNKTIKKIIRYTHAVYSLDGRYSRTYITELGPALFNTMKPI